VRTTFARAYAFGCDTGLCASSLAQMIFRDGFVHSDPVRRGPGSAGLRGAQAAARAVLCEIPAQAEGSTPSPPAPAPRPPFLPQHAANLLVRKQVRRPRAAQPCRHAGVAAAACS
jgi:hypothetical protein